jgi:hypothetical protein
LNSNDEQLNYSEINSNNEKLIMSDHQFITEKGFLKAIKFLKNLPKYK